MRNNTIQLLRTTNTSFASNVSVVFDEVLHQTPGILYDENTGIITIISKGRFIINWWVSMHTAASSIGTSFSISGPNIAPIPGTSGSKNGQIFGSAILYVDSTPTQISLVNSTGTPVVPPSALPATASLLLFQIDEDEAGIYCYGQQQVAHIIDQLITLYPGQPASIYLERVATISNVVPQALYTAPDAQTPSAVVFLQDTTYITIPLDSITAISLGNVPYNPDITYLPTPDRMPNSCINDKLVAVHAAVQVGSEQNVAVGVNTSFTATVIQNHIGIIVLGDTSTTPPQSPVFVAANGVRFIGASSPPATLHQNVVPKQTPHQRPIVIQDAVASL